MLVLSTPAIYSLEITPACNQRCQGCANVFPTSQAAAAQKALPGAVWSAWIKTILPHAVRIRLTGGEPTLHPDFFSILESATAGEAWVTIFTNGQWRRPAEFLGRLQGWPQLTGLLISLHGATRTSHEVFTGVNGSFARAVANVRLALEYGVEVALSVVVHRYNWRQVEEITRFAESLGVQHVSFNRYMGSHDDPLLPATWQIQRTIADIERLAAAGAPVRHSVCIPQCFMPNQSEGCMAGVSSVAVDPWGSVRPCIYSPTKVGTLLEADWPTLWLGDKMNAWRALLDDECLNCSALEVCHGGCRAAKELLGNGRDPLQQSAISTFAPRPREVILPIKATPRFSARVRKEDFGFVLLGHSDVLPVSDEALTVIEACNGLTNIQELGDKFGEPGLELLGELWHAGMLEL